MVYVRAEAVVMVYENIDPRGGTQLVFGEGLGQVVKEKVAVVMDILGAED